MGLDLESVWYLGLGTGSCLRLHHVDQSLRKDKTLAAVVPLHLHGYANRRLRRRHHYYVSSGSAPGIAVGYDGPEDNVQPVGVRDQHSPCPEYVSIHSQALLISFA